jgi:hypothetical protein
MWNERRRRWKTDAGWRSDALLVPLLAPGRGSPSLCTESASWFAELASSLAELASLLAESTASSAELAFLLSKSPTSSTGSMSTRSNLPAHVVLIKTDVNKSLLKSTGLKLFLLTVYILADNSLTHYLVLCPHSVLDKGHPRWQDDAGTESQVKSQVKSQVMTQVDTAPKGRNTFF